MMNELGDDGWAAQDWMGNAEELGEQREREKEKEREREREREEREEREVEREVEMGDADGAGNGGDEGDVRMYSPSPELGSPPRPAPRQWEEVRLGFEPLPITFFNPTRSPLTPTTWGTITVPKKKSCRSATPPVTPPPPRLLSPPLPKTGKMRPKQR
jgi:hypothetical protein